MPKFVDLTNQRYERLVCLKTTGKNAGGNYMWECACDCGNKIVASSGNIRFGHTKSCGCLDIERKTKHDMTRTPTYQSWSHMKTRCHSPTSDNYPQYGGKGITVCDSWLESFENFLEDMGERPDGTSLNRINNAKVYSKETCEWASASIQSFDKPLSKRNKSGKQGVRRRKDRKAWEARITKDNIIYILYYGPSLELAISARENAEKEMFGFISPKETE